jgi:hypothetical protein
MHACSRRARPRYNNKPTAGFQPRRKPSRTSKPSWQASKQDLFHRQLFLPKSFLMACVCWLASKGQDSRPVRISQPRGRLQRSQRQYLRQASARIQPNPCCKRSAAQRASTFLKQWTACFCGPQSLHASTAVSSYVYTRSSSLQRGKAKAVSAIGIDQYRRPWVGAQQARNRPWVGKPSTRAELQICPKPNEPKRGLRVQRLAETEPQAPPTP